VLVVAQHLFIDAIAKLAQHLIHADRPLMRVSLGPLKQLDKLSLGNSFRANRQRVTA
jgi:hypothetical protein